jgi:hypothetical protein
MREVENNWNLAARPIIVPGNLETKQVLAPNSGVQYDPPYWAGSGRVPAGENLCCDITICQSLKDLERVSSKLF